ncbi:hypothetical protein E5F05_13490 [Deinococcus metallilatus]|uniref:Uncharacterized protein n=1 Tax=Deinococcus metallilatus TaxID=1211322 RepID=A0AAJ5F3L0_9DEIO|nr:hypothetical protein [Deinococcus metallilatus]MBB5294078.1 hypothetical protein [Deinococcus metallilatus]QBY08863.1 hypothetical protein E5F05_13490 [Deinococcus metallilatus]RXJ10007.1 hypothetical protein ERJ73_12320 [Deinococcus metallilatus]TLK28056.1 hypothetical protein FCS05_09060 [Deinococcus metallilatus]
MNAVPMQGAPAGKASAADVQLVRSQGFPAMAAYQNKSDYPCQDETARDQHGDAQSVAGSFTRKGAKQRLVSVWYCGAANFNQYVLGVLEGNRLVAAYTVQGMNVHVEKFRDVNGNGTDDVIVRASYSGAGGMGGSAELADFHSGGLKSFGSFRTSDEVCPWYQGGDTEMHDDEYKIMVTPGNQPSFRQTIHRTECGSGLERMITGPVKGKPGFISLLKR